MGTADDPRFRKGFAGFKGDKMALLAEIFVCRPLGKRFCRGRQNLRKFTLWRVCEKAPDRKSRATEPFMSQFIDRYPTAAIWLFAILQGAAMLGLNVLLRALVS
jgi:hypothetical protein